VNEACDAAGVDQGRAAAIEMVLGFAQVQISRWETAALSRPPMCSTGLSSGQ